MFFLNGGQFFRAFALCTKVSTSQKDGMNVTSVPQSRADIVHGQRHVLRGILGSGRPKSLCHQKLRNIK